MSTSKDATLIRSLRQTVRIAIAAHVALAAGCATTPFQLNSNSGSLVPPVIQKGEERPLRDNESSPRTATKPQAKTAKPGDENKDGIQLPSERLKPMVIRGQSPSGSASGSASNRDDRPRQPMPVSGGEEFDDASDFDAPTDGGYFDPNVVESQYQDPYGGQGYGGQGYGPGGPPQNFAPQGGYFDGRRAPGPATVRPGDIGYGDGPNYSDSSQPFTGRYADLEVNVQEQQTGRFMFGVGVNSDAGVTAQVVIDEYNFDWRRFPRGVEDIMNGTAFRGGGQRLRIEAVPGSELQRYMVNFTEPYLILGGHQFTLSLSGYLFDRRYFDWDEQRLGGRIGLGYRLTPDLSFNTNLRMERVNINDPRIRGIADLEDVLGDSNLFSGTVSLRHDTRDSPFAPTEGHLIDLSYEQAFGTYSYPRAVAEYRRFFLLNERIDGSGRHVLGTSIRAGFSGSDTPLYEHFFAGGYSTIRGFRFRGASPKIGDVTVGGEFSLLGSAEYLFPITADDMLKGVVFCDYGTIEEEIEINKDDFRVSVGAGLRVTVPAMGPAPIALDLAVPITRENTDRIQNFSFFIGLGRN